MLKLTPLKPGELARLACLLIIAASLGAYAGFCGGRWTADQIDDGLVWRACNGDELICGARFYHHAGGE